MQFEELYTPENRRHVLSVCRGILGNLDDAEEAAQDAFLRAWQHLPSFRGQSGIATWLHAIARNQALDYLRRKRRVEIVSLSTQIDSSWAHSPRSFLMGELHGLTLADLIPAAGPSPEWYVVWNEVSEALDGLARGWRLPLRMQLEGYSMNEIGKAMGVLSALSIRGRLWRARHELKRKLRTRRSRTKWPSAKSRHAAG